MFLWRFRRADVCSASAVCGVLCFWMFDVECMIVELAFVVGLCVVCCGAGVGNFFQVAGRIEIFSSRRWSKIFSGK